MIRTNSDVTGDKCVKNDEGNLACTDEEKLHAWKQHYQKLLNEEFPWDEEHLVFESPCEGPPPRINRTWVINALRKMKDKKAAGATGITAEMLKAAGDIGIDILMDICNDIISEKAIPAKWDTSIILNLFKGKGAAVERGNYRGLKLIEHAMKVFERIIESLLRMMVNINAMQFGFMPGKGTTDAIFIVRQVQEKFLEKKKPLYYAFVDLEKAFDRVPRKVLEWSLRELKVDDWLVKVIMAMYMNARSKVNVNGQLGEEFLVKVGVHQGSVLSPILFAIVLEALSRHYRDGLPWEVLYADDLVIMAESLEELGQKLEKWKLELSMKGLKVNNTKTKIMISEVDAGVHLKSGKFPCGVCNKGVGCNSLRCTKCKRWIHARCSGVRGKLSEDKAKDFVCKSCLDPKTPTEQAEKIPIGNYAYDVVQQFCYLGDMLSAGGGAEATSVTRTRCAWKKFRELLPILTSRALSLKRKGFHYEACVRSIMLYGSETWPVKEVDTVRLHRTDMRMIRWMAGVKLTDRTTTSQLLLKVGLSPIRDLMQQRRLRWYGHVERMEDDNWVKRCRSLSVEGKRERGRPRKTWEQVVAKDMKEKKLHRTLAQDRVAWRKAITANSLTHACVD